MIKTGGVTEEKGSFAPDCTTSFENPSRSELQQSTQDKTKAEIKVMRASHVRYQLRAESVQFKETGSANMENMLLK